MSTFFSFDQSLKALSTYKSDFPSTLLILGSGWNALESSLESEFTITYTDLFGVTATVPGHDGKLVIGKLKSHPQKKVAVMFGRLHTYEGYSTAEVTTPIQVLHQRGIKNVIITAACGALNEHYQVGDFVIFNDIITAFCPSPLTGPQFVDLSQAFESQNREQALRICAEKQIPVQQGVYCYVRGPHFETPADKMLYRHLGADVIGMSTVPETIVAKSLGIQVLGLGFVTNLAFVKHDHQEVLKEAKKGSQRMVTLLSTLIQKS